MKIISLPSDLSTSNKNYINRPKLIIGRLPKKTGECVIENNKLSDIALNIGDKINLSSGDDSKLSDKLANEQYTIVGIIDSPMYISMDRGTTSIGNGQVSAFIEIPEKVGFSLFSTVFSKTSSALYTIPKIILTFNLPFAAISIIVGVGVTSIAALIVCVGELSTNASTLMRPRAPKPGKVILLERVKFIWNRLTFTQKLTARNLFRYKSRFFMTVIGVGGCTALLLVGFGLTNAISAIGAKQFGEIYTYQATLTYKDTATASEIVNIESTIKKQPDFLSSANLQSSNINIGLNNKEKSCNLIVPDSPESINKFINLKVRTTGKQVPISDDGVVITEKLATMIGAKIGDTIYI